MNCINRNLRAEGTSFGVWALAAVVLVGAASAYAQTLSGAGGATLESLAGSPTLVTVVLKNGAQDPNLQLMGVSDTTLSFKTASGERIAYVRNTVQEIRVQGAVVEGISLKPRRTRTLARDEQTIVTQAISRAGEIFHAPGVDQARKMQAATLMALDSDQAALDYLNALAGANDLETALTALRHLYLGGASYDAKALIDLGFASGIREARILAAQLAGLLGVEGYEEPITKMLRDPLPELAAPAMRAAGRLRLNEAIPFLVDSLGDINHVKGDAAIFGLIRIGGDEVTAQCRAVLDAGGNPTRRFRAAQVLYHLGDPLGEATIKREILDVPTLTVEAGVILSRKGDLDGRAVLWERLEERYEPTQAIFILRANMAAALLEGGDRKAVTVIQELLRVADLPVQIEVCNILAELGDRALLRVAQSRFDNANVELALAACEAALSSAIPDYNDRYLEYAREVESRVPHLTYRSPGA